MSDTPYVDDRGRPRSRRNVRLTIPQIVRAQKLRRAGLSANAICVVFEVDYGEAPCVETVRKYTSAWSPKAHDFARPPGRVGLTSRPVTGGAA